MPKIKIEKVISFSTEDNIHVASNLLSHDPSKKWKCGTAGEKSANVVVQLEKACVISAIDIGNEHSAYVEILVSRSSQSDDYKVLLVMSSFMSPLEARSSTNVNKVRMFTSDQLMKPENEQKWDRVKIVCTQPFNKHVKYGLCFIALHTNEDKVELAATPSLQFGRFGVRSESPDNLTTGNLFARRKEFGNNTPLKAAAAIRAADASPSNSSRKLAITPKPKSPNSTVQTTADSPPIKDRNRRDIVYSEVDDTPNEKIDKLIKRKLAEDELKKKANEDKNKNSSDKNNKPKDAKVTIAKKTEVNDKTANNKHKTINDKIPINTKATGSKRKSDVLESSHKKLKMVQRKPFSQLLSGVTLVISGIQNPDRANLRTAALSMGAKYKPDWEKSCTHLICAFPNTPKFNQVKGKGKIVTKNWIIDCNSERKKLPWRRYALDSSDKGQDESEEEILEETASNNNETSVRAFDGSDTDDEIERIQAKNKKTSINNKAKISPNTNNVINDYSKPSTSKQVDDDVEMKIDVKNESDDSESSNLNDITHTQKILQENDKVKKLIAGQKLPTLANFFNSTHFYIDDTLSENDKKSCVQYITAYNGKVIDNIIDPEVEIIISSYESVENLKEEYAGKAKFVTKDWLYECHNEQKIVDFDDFLL